MRGGPWFPVNKSVLLVAGAVVSAVALPAVLADLLAGAPDGGRAASAPDPAYRQADRAPPDTFSPTTYVKCRSAAEGDRFAVYALSEADGDLDMAIEIANLWASMLPDNPPDSDCHWKCILHGLNRTSCDPVYAPIVLPCGPGAEDYTCQSFVCSPVWDGARSHCGYRGNVTGHTHVITDGPWTRSDP